MPRLAPDNSTPSSWVGVQPAQRSVRIRASPSNARRAQQAKHGDIGGGLSQHIWRVSDGDAAGARRRQGDVLVARRERRNDAHAVRQAFDHGARPRIGRAGEDRSRIGAVLDQFVCKI